jgi:hypothetical protein
MKKRDTQKEITFESYLQRVSSAKNNFESLNEDKYEYVYDEGLGIWRKVKKAYVKTKNFFTGGKKKSASDKMQKMQKTANADKAVAKGIIEKHFPKIMNIVRSMRKINMTSIKTLIMSILLPLFNLFEKNKNDSNAKQSKIENSENSSYNGKVKNKNIFSEDYEIYNESIPFLSLRQNRNLSLGGVITISVNHYVNGALRKEIYKINEFANEIKFERSVPALSTPIDYKEQIWKNIYKDTAILNSISGDTVKVTDWKSASWVEFYTFISNAASSKNTRDMADNVSDIKNTTNKIDATTGRIETATGEINAKADKIDATTTRTEQSVDRLVSSARNFGVFVIVAFAIIFIFFAVLFYFHFQQMEAIESESRINLMKSILNDLKMEDLQKRAIDMNQNITDARAEIADLNTNMETRFTSIDGKLDILEKNQGDILNNQTIADTKITAINGAVKGIKRSLVSIANDMKNVSTTNNKIASIVKIIKNGQDATNKDLADLTQLVKDSNDDQLTTYGLTTLQIEKLRETTNELQRTVDDVNIKTNSLIKDAIIEDKIKDMPYIKELLNTQDYKDAIAARDANLASNDLK